MWTATLESASNADKVWAYTIVYTDGQQKFRREYRGDIISDALIESVARSEIARLTSVADGWKLTYANGATVNTAAVAPKPPSDAEIAQAKFLADYRQLQALLRAVDGGFIDIADKRITDLLASTKAAWLDSYVGLV